MNWQASQDAPRSWKTDPFPIVYSWIAAGLFVCCVGLAACKKPTPVGSNALAERTPREQKTLAAPEKRVPLSQIDACSLLTKGEVGEIQGAEIVDVRSSGSAAGSLFVSQCYYGAKELSKSVSFTLTQNDVQRMGNNAVEGFWEQTFGRLKTSPNGTGPKVQESGEREREGGEPENPPQEVAGLGEEAYWAANSVGGALYVLKKNAVLRISVGGPGDSSGKLQRSKALARKAVDRL